MRACVGVVEEMIRPKAYRKRGEGKHRKRIEGKERVERYTKETPQGGFFRVWSIPKAWIKRASYVPPVVCSSGSLECVHCRTCFSLLVSARTVRVWRGLAYLHRVMYLFCSEETGCSIFRLSNRYPLRCTRLVHVLCTVLFSIEADFSVRRVQLSTVLTNFLPCSCGLFWGVVHCMQGNLRVLHYMSLRLRSRSRVCFFLKRGIYSSIVINVFKERLLD